jgi:hypothetical protein
MIFVRGLRCLHKKGQEHKTVLDPSFSTCSSQVWPSPASSFSSPPFVRRLVSSVHLVCAAGLECSLGCLTGASRHCFLRAPATVHSAQTAAIAKLLPRKRHIMLCTMCAGVFTCELGICGRAAPVALTTKSHNVSYPYMSQRHDRPSTAPRARCTTSLRVPISRSP